MTLTILIALSVYAIHIILNEHPAFKWGIVRMDYYAPDIITKPLYSCPMCMCMTWGVLLYFIPYDFSHVVLIILSAMAINRIYADHVQTN